MYNGHLFESSKLIFCVVLLSALGGCAAVENSIKDSLEGKTRDDDSAMLSQRESSINRANIEKMLKRAERLEPLQQDTIYAEAIHVYLDLDETQKAWKLYQNLKSSTAAQDSQIQYLREIAKARFANLDGQPRKSVDILVELSQEDALALMNRSVKTRLFETKAQLYSDLGLFEEVISARIKLSSLIEQNVDQYDFNNDIIWNTVSALSDAEFALLQASDVAKQRQAAGWIALARAVRNNASSLNAQLQAIQEWQRQWSTHPAGQKLPSELQALNTLSLQGADRIAVLLPESGKLAGVGKAIRDGISAAYFAQRSRGESAPDLVFYDSARVGIDRTYQQAIDEGADAVIGPLDKDTINELLRSTGPVVPTMVLNEIDSLSSPLENFYQFGLPVEDESRQVAERAWRDGHRKVMVLVPSSAWGNRSAAAFEQAWVEQGGQILKQAMFEQPRDFSPLIEDAMGIKESDYRHRELQKIIGRRAEFEPRARNDVDMIFMLAKPEEARQLKPTLNFHYAGDVPVYATSHIYNGEQDADSDRDLNGVMFTSLPWFFDSQSIEKRSIEENTNASAFFERLYAFGVDAYHLQSRLAQMAYLPQLTIQGASGKLSMDTQKRVKREQLWAIFESGVAVPLAPLSVEESREDFSRLSEIPSSLSIN